MRQGYRTGRTLFRSAGLAVVVGLLTIWLASLSASAAETVVDNTSAGFSTGGGTWSVSTTTPGYYGTNYAFDGTSTAANPGQWAKWTPDIAEAGDYAVYMRWTAHENRPDAAPIEIGYVGGTDSSQTVNQQENGGMWVYIGTYAMSASSTMNYVKIDASDTGATIADAVRFVKVPDDIIIDNADSGFSTIGVWSSSTTWSGYYGSDYLVDGTSTAADPGKWAVWTPTISQPGNYQIYMRWTKHANRPDAAPVEIVHAGGTDSGKTVNQQVNNGVWVLLGTYNLAAGTGNNVRLSAEDTGVTVADAVKFSYVAGPPAAPTGLSGASGSSSHINLSWTDMADDEEGFIIYRKKTSDTAYAVAGYAPADATAYQSVGLLADTAYEHKVVAYNANGSSPAAALGSVTTESATATARGLKITPSGRNGEGDIIKRTDGSLMYIYARYPRGADTDPDNQLYVTTSSDDGVTWSTPVQLFSGAARGTFQASMERLDDGNIGLSYTSYGGVGDSRKVFRYSSDEGATWSAEIDITLGDYASATGTNARLHKMSDGRLLQIFHTSSGGKQRTGIYSSDDNGLTWVNRTSAPGALLDADGEYFWEADLVEVEPNQLLLYGRTKMGWLYESRSSDNGNTWTTPVSARIPYSSSPPKLSKIPGTNTLVFIGCGYNVEDGERYALSTQISNDGGRTWTNYKQVEYTNEGYTHQYAAVYMDDATDTSYLVYSRNGPTFFVNLPFSWYTTNPAWPY